MHNLEKHNFQAIARDMKVPVEEVYEAVREIQKLESRPARNFSEEQPDLDPDKGGLFNNYCRNKLGVTINMRMAKGRALAERLIAQSSIVTENFADEQGQRWPVEVLIQTEDPADFGDFEEAVAGGGEVDEYVAVADGGEDGGNGELGGEDDGGGVADSIGVVGDGYGAVVVAVADCGGAKPGV